MDEQALDDLMHIIRLIEDDKIKCCDEIYHELCNLYDNLEDEQKHCYDEGLTYEDKYDV